MPPVTTPPAGETSPASSTAAGSDEDTVRLLRAGAANPTSTPAAPAIAAALPASSPVGTSSNGYGGDYRAFAKSLEADVDHHLAVAPAPADVPGLAAVPSEISPPAVAAALSAMDELSRMAGVEVGDGESMVAQIQKEVND